MRRKSLSLKLSLNGVSQQMKNEVPSLFVYCRYKKGAPSKVKMFHKFSRQGGIYYGTFKFFKVYYIQLV